MSNRRVRHAAPLVAALYLIFCGAALAQEPPTSLLPPGLGQQSAPPPAFDPNAGQPLPGQTFQGQFQGQPGAPAPAFNPLQNQLAAPPPLPGGTQVLGTIPSGPSDASGSLGTIPQSAAVPITGGAFTEILSQFTAPLPSAVLQRAAREILRDRALVETADPLARAGALYALGFAEDAAGAAIEATPGDVAGRALTARALLAVGQREQACARADVDNLPKDAQPGPTFELLEVLALCKLEQGSADAASLIAGLIREQGGGDALFFALLDAATGKQANLPDPAKVANVRPIHLALMRRAGIVLPAAYVPRADLALISLLARDDALDTEARIAATERAVEAGLAPSSTLIGLYETTPLNEQMLMQAASDAAPPGALARAHLFALVAEARDDRDRLRFIAAMYAQGRGAGVGGAIAEVVGEDAAGIEADPSLGAAAPLMAEILTRADRPRAAVRWVDAGEFPGPGGQPALSRIAAHRVRAMIAVSAPDLGLGVAAGALGADAGGGALTPPERQFIDTEVAIMSALGDPVSPILVEIVGRPATPPAAASPIGVLAALAPLSGIPLDQADNGKVAAALAALAGYGLAVEARRLAVETLAARPVG